MDDKILSKSHFLKNHVDYSLTFADGAWRMVYRKSKMGVIVSKADALEFIGVVEVANGEEAGIADDEMTLRGEKLAEVFNIKKERGRSPARYVTDWGNKTAGSVFLTAKAIVEKGGND